MTQVDTPGIVLYITVNTIYLPFLRISRSNWSLNHATSFIIDCIQLQLYIITIIITKPGILNFFIETMSMIIN